MVIWVRRRPHAERRGRFRLSQVVLCHFTMSLSLTVRTRVGSGEAGSLSVHWCSWENTRRGVHGSTSEHREGLCAVVPVSHEYLEATASDLGSVGECANLRALCELWCQDGKVQLEQRHGWHGMCCAVQTAHPSVRLHSSFCLKHVGL